MNEIIEKTIGCFKDARQRVAEGMQYLYEINKSDIWDNGQYSSFTDFVESGCGISRGFASRLLSIYQHYVIEGKVSQGNLFDIDAQKLYLAIKLPGSPSNQLIKADTLTRRELQDELASDEFGDCTHEHTYTLCSRCHKKIE